MSIANLSGFKPVIYGFWDTTLNREEIAFFKEAKPMGFILFSRNISSHDQLKKLCSDLVDISDNDKIIISIDQEGGKVQRIRPPIGPEYKTAQYFADLYEKDTEAAKNELREQSKQIAVQLKEYGINTNYAPVLDLLHEGSHEIVKNRSFGSNVDKIIDLTSVQIQEFAKHGLLSCGKHVPGHGRANADSHFELPIITTMREELERTDFAPFKALASVVPFFMTAHIIYSAIDPVYPATFSKAIINIIRNHFEFNGLIMTDDLCMKALQGTMEYKVFNALEAKCDIMLHCSGNMGEMVEIDRALKGTYLTDRQLGAI